MSIKLCIDPGHGLANTKLGVYDSGATAGGVTEADIAFTWALTIKFVFKNAGLEIFLTRDDRSAPTPVSRRNELAEAAGCTHFLALHCNSGGGTGTECYYRDDEVWASEVLKVALSATQLRNRGIHREGESQHSRLAVMDFRGQSCLLELGFIDHPHDRGVLTSRAARIRFAEGLRDLIQSMG